jgi:hypothetical protein
MEYEIELSAHRLWAILLDANELDLVRAVVFLFARHLASLTPPAGLMIYK